MNKYNKLFIITLGLYFLTSWPVQVGTYRLPALIMSTVPKYAGYVFFEHITFMTLIKYLLFILCIFYFIFIERKNKNKFLKYEAISVFTLVLFYLYRIVSLFLLNNNQSIFNKINISIDYLILICLLYIVYKNKINTEKIIITIGKVNAIAIFIQVLQYSNRIHSFSDLRVFRFTGLMISPIIVSIVISFSLLIIISVKERYYYIKAIFMLIACILTGSRTWLIVIVIYILISVFFKTIPKSNKRNKNSKKIYYKSIFTIIILVTVSIAITIKNYSLIEQGVQQYYNDMLVKNDYGENSIRDVKRNIASNLFKENPIFGKGTSTYPYYQNQLINSRSNPHNIYFELLSENGLIGLILFVMFIVYNAYVLVKKKRYIGLRLLVAWITLAYTIGMLEFSGMLILILILNSGSRGDA